ncbi:MAG: hypothetical protein ACK4ZJ_16630, partial [Allorhizobium sp.]
MAAATVRPAAPDAASAAALVITAVTLDTVETAQATLQSLSTEGPRSTATVLSVGVPELVRRFMRAELRSRDILRSVNKCLQLALRLYCGCMA